MGPPGFKPCYLCKKEFGSSSILIHEPQCLGRWKANNLKLPITQQQKTPSPPEEQSRSQSLSLLNVEEPLNISWPLNETPKADGEKRPRSSSHPGRKEFRRPSTATLSQPKVLDENLKFEIDMSVMSRHMMNKLIMKVDTKGSSDYSSDFTSSSSSLSSRSPCEETPTSYDSESESKKRPSTMRLNRQTSKISVPVISSSPRTLPRRGRTATIKSHIPLRKQMMLADDILTPKQKLLVPEPCNACGKDQNPERFHTHPESVAKFKAKLKLSKDKKFKENGKNPSKLVVTKPTALRYKSRLLQESLETSNGRSNQKEPYPKPSMRYAQENNPKKQRRKVSLLTHPMKSSNAVARKESLSGSAEALLQIPEKTEEEAVRQSDPDEPETEPNAEGAPDDEERPPAATEPPKISGVPANGKKMAAIKSKSKPAEYNSGLVDKRPMRVCYICGRPFGTSSLKIHQPQCLEKWNRENDNLSANLRRPEPIKPDNNLTKEEWNEHAWKTAQQQLVPCGNCGRTFFPERLEVHQRGCKLPSGRRPSPAASEYKAARKVSARPSVVCYVCGRDFGTRSIVIHEPQCVLKWKHENDKLPAHLRQNEPKKPEVVLDENGEVDKVAMSEAAWKCHLDTLVKCTGCSRTFYPDRLEIHKKSCHKVD